MSGPERHVATWNDGTMDRASQALDTAMRHHREGRLADAEAIYRDLLSAEPRNSDAMHLLGLIVYQRRDHDGAVRLIQQAIAIHDSDPSYHSNLGRILGELGRTDEAVAYCRAALALNPDFDGARNNLGTILAARGNWDDAVAEYRHVLARMPGNIEALNNLAVALRHLGNRHAAIECSRRVLALSPGNADALLALAADARLIGDLDAAAELCRRVLAGNPNHVDALAQLGNVARRQGKPRDAIDFLQKAIANGADSPEIHYSLGAAFEARHRFDLARASYRRALQLKPNFPGAELGLVHVSQQLCDWNGLDERIERVRGHVEQVMRPALSPFSFLALPGVTAAEQKQWAELWAEDRYRPLASGRPSSKFRAGASEHDFIRLGYLSADYHDHATAHLLAEVIELHDRGRFHVHAYSYGPDDAGDMRHRLGAAFDRFTDIKHLSFIDAARRINDDGIDILIDLKGYTQNTRSDILALRPAPIQVNFLGYPGTMGVEFIDYLVTDDFITPPEAAVDYSESLAYLPDCYQPNDRKRPIGDRPSRRECGLPDQGVVFCCMNSAYKITPRVFAVWCGLLDAIPGSVLWLHKSNRWAEINLAKEARRRGLDPTRLVFADKKPHAQHLGRLQLADLFLDTLPYNAHTTASDALWCGVPIVTCAGNTFAARVAGSLLTAVRLPELITGSLEDYYKLALRLGANPDELAALKAKLMCNRSTAPLFDSTRYTRNLESLFGEMHRRRLTGETPRLIRLKQ